MGDTETIQSILAPYENNRGKIIPIIHQVQERFGYVPKSAMLLIADKLQIPESEVYAVVTFYKKFRLFPLGRKHVEVCRGTACHISGARQILLNVVEVLGIQAGETSPDLEYSLDTAACFGCCALAPCLRINGEVHGQLRPENVREIFDNDSERRNN